MARLPTRSRRSCLRGLTGRSTGGATAGRLARAAQCAYPPPRGQGVLPRPPGYLYVRPHITTTARAAKHANSMTPCLRRSATLAIAAFSGICFAAPNADYCSGVERWATSVAFGHLKNARLTDNHKLDFKKTKTVRIASERIGKDLFRQVHHVVFTEKSGRKIAVITVNDASSEECSMSGVQVYVVTQQLGER